jgi:hypothetical protein
MLPQGGCYALCLSRPVPGTSGSEASDKGYPVNPASQALTVFRIFTTAIMLFQLPVVTGTPKSRSHVPR